MAKRAGKTGERSITAEKGGARAPRSTRNGSVLLISKTRTKKAATLNVASDFYGALDRSVRSMIKEAEARATNNGRRTLRPHDL